MPDTTGVNSVQALNVHTIALQVPITEVTRHGDAPDEPARAPSSVIGVWATASRRKSRIFDKAKGRYVGHGPWEQVSRLGNPLFNEVIVPMAEKDEWNARPPSGDSALREVRQPPRAGQAAAGALPGRVPEPRGVHTSRGRT